MEVFIEVMCMLAGLPATVLLTMSVRTTFATRRTAADGQTVGLPRAFWVVLAVTTIPLVVVPLVNVDGWMFTGSIVLELIGFLGCMLRMEVIAQDEAHTRPRALLMAEIEAFMAALGRLVDIDGKEAERGEVLVRILSVYGSLEEKAALLRSKTAELNDEWWTINGLDAFA